MLGACGADSLDAVETPLDVSDAADGWDADLSGDVGTADAPGADTGWEDALPDAPVPRWSPAVAPLVLEPVGDEGMWVGRVRASSLAGDRLTYEVLGVPAEARFDRQTGRILWRFEGGSTRLRQPLVLRVIDEQGAETTLVIRGKLGEAGPQRPPVVEGLIRWPAGVDLWRGVDTGSLVMGAMRFRARGTVPPGLELMERSGMVRWRAAQRSVGDRFSMEWRASQTEGATLDGVWHMEVVDALPLTEPARWLVAGASVTGTLVTPDVVGTTLGCRELTVPGAAEAGVSWTLSPNGGGCEVDLVVGEGLSDVTALRASWMVDTVSRAYLVEQTWLVTPPARCPIAQPAFGVVQGVRAWTGPGRETFSYALCSEVPGVLEEVEVVVPEGVSRLDALLSYQRVTGADIDLWVWCDGALAGVAQGVAGTEAIGLAVSPGQRCRAQLRSAWPVLEPVDVRLELEVGVEAPCTQESGLGPLRSTDLALRRVCPGQVLTLPLEQGMVALQVGSTDARLDVELVERREGQEEVLRAVYFIDAGPGRHVTLPRLETPLEGELLLRVRGHSLPLEGAPVLVIGPDRRVQERASGR